MKNLLHLVFHPTIACFHFFFVHNKFPARRGFGLFRTGNAVFWVLLSETPCCCKSLIHRFGQNDPACTRLNGRFDPFAGGALPIGCGDDRPAAVDGAQRDLLCPAVEEVRLCRFRQSALCKMSAALVHSQQLCDGQAADLPDDEHIQPAVVGLRLGCGQNPPP